MGDDDIGINLPRSRLRGREKNQVKTIISSGVMVDAIVLHRFVRLKTTLYMKGYGNSAAVK